MWNVKIVCFNFPSDWSGMCFPKVWTWFAGFTLFLGFIIDRYLQKLIGLRTSVGSSKEERILERKEATQRKRRESFQDIAGARRKVDEYLQGNCLLFIWPCHWEKWIWKWNRFGFLVSPPPMLIPTILLFQFSGTDIIILFNNFFCELNITRLGFGNASIKKGVKCNRKNKNER